MTEQEIGPDEAVQRLVAKLTNPRSVYTSSQVAFLMGTAGRWAREAVDGEPSELSYRAGYQDGYRARVAEENAAYAALKPHDVVAPVREDAIRVHRARERVDERHVRDVDFLGAVVGDQS